MTVTPSAAGNVVAQILNNDAPITSTQQTVYAQASQAAPISGSYVLTLADNDELSLALTFPAYTGGYTASAGANASLTAVKLTACRTKAPSLLRGGAGFGPPPTGTR